MLLPAFVAAEGPKPDRPRTLVLRAATGHRVLAYALLRATDRGSATPRRRTGSRPQHRARPRGGRSRLRSRRATPRRRLLPYGVRFVLMTTPARPRPGAGRSTRCAGLVRVSRPGRRRWSGACTTRAAGCGCCRRRPVVRRIARRRATGAGRRSGRCARAHRLRAGGPAARVADRATPAGARPSTAKPSRRADVRRLGAGVPPAGPRRAASPALRPGERGRGCSGCRSALLVVIVLVLPAAAARGGCRRRGRRRRDRAGAPRGHGVARGAADDPAARPRCPAGCPGRTRSGASGRGSPVAWRTPRGILVVVVVLLLVGLGVARRPEPAPTPSRPAAVAAPAQPFGRRGAGQRRLPRPRRRTRRPRPRSCWPPPERSTTGPPTRGPNGLGCPAPAGCRGPPLRARRASSSGYACPPRADQDASDWWPDGTVVGHGAGALAPGFTASMTDPQQQRRHPRPGQHRLRAARQRLLVRRQRRGRGAPRPALPQQPRVGAGGRRRRRCTARTARSTRRRARGVTLAAGAQQVLQARRARARRRAVRRPRAGAPGPGRRRAARPAARRGSPRWAPTGCRRPHPPARRLVLPGVAGGARGSGDCRSWSRATRDAIVRVRLIVTDGLVRAVAASTSLEVRAGTVSGRRPGRVHRRPRGRRRARLRPADHRRGAEPRRRRGQGSPRWPTRPPPARRCRGSGVVTDLRARQGPASASRCCSPLPAGPRPCRSTCCHPRSARSTGVQVPEGAQVSVDLGRSAPPRAFADRHSAGRVRPGARGALGCRGRGARPVAEHRAGRRRRATPCACRRSSPTCRPACGRGARP